MNSVLFGGGRCDRSGRGSGGWGRIRFRFGVWLWRCRFGIGRGVIGGLFVGLADGFAPGIGAVGVDVFVLGEGQGLHESLAEIGEGGGVFGLHLALGDSGEEASEGGAEIASGHIAAGKVIGDILAGGLACTGLGRRGYTAKSRSLPTRSESAIAALGK